MTPGAMDNALMTGGPPEETLRDVSSGAVAAFFDDGLETCPVPAGFLFEEAEIRYADSVQGYSTPERTTHVMVVGRRGGKMLGEAWGDGEEPDDMLALVESAMRLAYAREQKERQVRPNA